MNILIDQSLIFLKEIILFLFNSRFSTEIIFFPSMRLNFLISVIFFFFLKSMKKRKIEIVNEANSYNSINDKKTSNIEFKADYKKPL